MANSAANDTASVLEDSVVAIDVLANDGGGNNKQLYSLNQGNLQVQTPAGVWVTLPSGARVRFQNNLVEYDVGALDHLAAGAALIDTFSYSIRFNNGTTSSANVAVTVTGINDAPIAAPDAAGGSENQVLTINVLANDSDVDDGAVLTVTAASGPAGKGSVSIVGNQLQFNPGTDFDHLAQGATEIVVLSYTMKDQQGATSSSFITITVTGANDGPVASSDSAMTAENSSVSINVLANDTDVDDGATKTLVAVSPPPGKGAASIVAGQVQFSPGTAFDHLAQGATETVVLSYTMQDEHGATSSSTITLTVTGTNDGPVANSDAAATTQNGSVTIDALANDTDVDDGAVLTLTAASPPPGQGSVAVLGNQLEYSAGNAFDFLAAGETIDVVVGYDIEDEHGARASSTATITVLGINDAPTIDAGNTAATASITELPNGDPGEGTAIHEADGVVAFDDIDLSDLHSASATAQSGGYLGTLILDPANQDDNSISWHFDVSDAALNGLEAGEIVTQTYSITVSDGHGGSATQDVTITLNGAAENAVPQAAADSAATSEDVSVTIDILANDVDLDGDPLTAEIVSGPSHGSLALDALTGSYLYQPAPNFHGDDLFTYRVSDPTGAQSDIVSVSITVASINDAPVLTQSIPTQSGRVLEPLSVTLPSGLVVDDDGNGTIAYSATLADGAPLPAWLSFDPTTTTFSGSPGSADVGRYVIRVTGAEADGQAAGTAFLLVIVDGLLIQGNAAGETITGSVNADFISAFGGDDVVNASASADVVDGGSDNDQLNGEAGDDLLMGGDGYDTLRGGDG
ncbi:MAG TPA: Ig-like domain-containing protein, partial [Allosphingosinicella sp.]|nr:Ig-like domain-containing protein [Allosphingosinicella sp.]